MVVFFRVLALVVLTSCGSSPPLVSPRSEVVEGLVVDQAGTPVAGVEVAPFWRFDDGILSAWNPLVTNAQGRFRGPIDLAAKSVLAYTADRSASAIADVGLDASLKLVLAPTNHVRGRLRYPKGARAGAMLYWMKEGESQWIVSAFVDDQPFSIPLPAASFRWWGWHIDVEPAWGSVTLDGHDDDIGGVAFEISRLGSLTGSPLPPWTVTSARGVPEGKTSLQDFRGKWLLIEFWSYG